MNDYYSVGLENPRLPILVSLCCPCIWMMFTDFLCLPLRVSNLNNLKPQCITF
ncbi:hypothetical protein ACE6H2_000061 [Prunus campanulata]